MEPFIPSPVQTSNGKNDTIEKCDSVYLVKTVQRTFPYQYYYSVYSTQGNIPLLKLINVRQCCAPPSIEIFSFKNETHPIGTFRHNCCSCTQGLTLTVDGHDAGKVEMNNSMCNFMINVLDSSGQVQYIISKQNECECCDCRFCCPSQSFSNNYDIYERDLNNRPTGGMRMEYKLITNCCCNRLDEPTIFFEFPPNTPKNAKLCMVAICFIFYAQQAAGQNVHYSTINIR